MSASPVFLFLSSRIFVTRLAATIVTAGFIATQETIPRRHAQSVAAIDSVSFSQP